MLGFSVLDRGKFGFWRLRGGFNMGCDGSFGGREAKDAEDGWWISVKRGNFGMTTTGALITDFMLLTSYSWRMVTCRWGRIVVPFRCHVGSGDCLYFKFIQSTL